MTYSFGSMVQSKAVMNSLDYEVYDKEEQVYVKFGGRIRKKMEEAEISPNFRSVKLSRDHQKQLRSILRKYLDISAYKEELKKTLKEKFGIILIIT